MASVALSMAECQQRVLAVYQEHLERVDGWIELLTDQANLLLVADRVVDAASSNDDSTAASDRTVRGMFTVATRLVSTICRLSKDKVNISMLLARHAQSLTPRADNLCALEAAPDAPAVPNTTPPVVATCDQETVCNASQALLTRALQRAITPVRASDEKDNSGLSEALAQEAEGVFGRPDAVASSATTRQMRRQRAKELRRARK